MAHLNKNEYWAVVSPEEGNYIVPYAIDVDRRNAIYSFLTTRSIPFTLSNMMEVWESETREYGWQLKVVRIEILGDTIKEVRS